MSLPCDLGNRSLVEHTEGTLKIAKRIAEGSYGAVASKRLTYAGVETTHEKFVKNTAIVCVMHDVGKAALFYQRNFDEKCNCKGSKSFYGHEIISATYTFHLLDEYSSFEDRMLVTLAVLNHMLAGGRYIGSSKLQSKSEEILRNDDYFKLHQGVSKVLALLPQDIFESIKDSFEVPKISPGRAKEVLDKIESEVRKKHNKWLKLYVLYLAPLLAGDSLDAEKRKESEGNEMREKFREKYKEELRYFSLWEEELSQ